MRLNVPVVVAAGNDGTENLNHYPSAFTDPICVAALNCDGSHADFSTHHNNVDVGDAGVNIDGLNIDGSLTCKSGTSMACPIVAAKIGLLMSYCKQHYHAWPTEAQAYKLLIGCCVDLYSNGFDQYTGYGFPALTLPAKRATAISLKRVVARIKQLYFRKGIR